MLLPQIKAEFALSNAVAEFMLTVIWLVYALIQFPAGILSDRYGEKSMLFAGLFFGAMNVFLFTISFRFFIFLIACVLFGFGSG